MVAKRKLDTMLVCSQCGSSKLGKSTNNIETYCRSCGTVIEDMLIKY